MKLTCPISGLAYSINSGYATMSAAHPALDVPFAKLVAQLSDFHSGKIHSSEDQYLYLLAWFKNLPSVQFRAACVMERDFPLLVLHSAALFRIVMSCAKFQHLPFPTLVISTNSTLQACLAGWLATHDEILNEQKVKASKQRANAEILRLETSLERIAAFAFRTNLSKAAKLVAAWAAKAGDFSNSYITSPTGQSLTLSQYWQDIIVIAFKESHTEFLAAKITPADLSELVEYCEDNIPHGTTYSFELMKRLRSAQRIVKELSDGLTPVQLDVEITEEMLTRPEQKDFVSSIDYLRAKVRYQKHFLIKREQDKQAQLAAQKDSEKERKQSGLSLSEL